jgi:multiple antibiotic resistance protein
MGPFKAVLVYMGSTAGMAADVKHRIATKMVLVAGIVAVGLFILGKAVLEFLHFSDAAITIAAGLILLLLALRMAMGGGAGGGHEGGGVDPEAIAIFPLALPLTLNPIGMVASSRSLPRLTTPVTPPSSSPSSPESSSSTISSTSLPDGPVIPTRMRWR